MKARACRLLPEYYLGSSWFVVTLSVFALVWIVRLHHHNIIWVHRLAFNASGRIRRWRCPILLLPRLTKKKENIRKEKSAAPRSITNSFIPTDHSSEHPSIRASTSSPSPEMQAPRTKRKPANCSAIRLASERANANDEVTKKQETCALE